MLFDELYDVIRESVTGEVCRMESAQSPKKSNYYLLYHSTDSSFFQTVQYDNAKKGDRYFNPLGNGLYFSTNIDFSKTFGRNTYYYQLPKSAKIKKITLTSWRDSSYPSILRKILRVYNINWDGMDIQKKVDLNRLGNDSPIASLNELTEFLTVDFKLPNVQRNMEMVVDRINSKYDAIWYKSTNYYNAADELLIPRDKFDPTLFTATDPIQSRDIDESSTLRESQDYPYRFSANFETEMRENDAGEEEDMFLPVQIIPVKPTTTRSSSGMPSKAGMP